MVKSFAGLFVILFQHRIQEEANRQLKMAVMKEMLEERRRQLN